jgi:hypothetical protein
MTDGRAACLMTQSFASVHFLSKFVHDESFFLSEFHLLIKLDTRMMNNVLKRPVYALALIAVVAISPTFGFTNKVGNGMNIVHSRSNFALSIASVSEENTQAVSDDEYPQPRSYLDDGFVFGLEDSGLDRPKGKQGEHHSPFSDSQQDSSLSKPASQYLQRKWSSRATALKLNLGKLPLYLQRSWVMVHLHPTLSWTCFPSMTETLH